MIKLDALWGHRRTIQVSGQTIQVPFAVELPDRFVEPLRRWITRSGTAWAKQRCKDLKLWSLHILAGNQQYSSPWFKTEIVGGYRIPALAIFRHLIRHRHNLQEVVKVLMVLESHKQVMEGSPSLKGIVDTPKSAPSLPYIKKLRMYCNLPTVPDSVLGKVDLVNTTKKWADENGETHPGPYGKRDYSKYSVQPSVFTLFEGVPAPAPPDPILGRLTAIPDKGKWRTILIGQSDLQLQTKKLADWLRRWLWDQPEVASGDQGRFKDFIGRAFSEGRTLLSIDLSSATDRLSAEFQKQLLISMGVPEDYFEFLSRPFVYKPSQFGECGKGLKKAFYSNGQPMGLFVSFPMFELMHYVILKFACAVSEAAFMICGDDVVISCPSAEVKRVFSRYRTLIERFGGVIADHKTMISTSFAEGVGAIYLKGFQKEIRIPRGHISPLEASVKGTWLYKMIVKGHPVGRAIVSAWLSAKENQTYTFENRRAANESLVFDNLSDLSLDSLRLLAAHETDPLTWKSWETPPPGTRLNTPKTKVGEDIQGYPQERVHEEKAPLVYEWISTTRYRDKRLFNKIITLFKQERQRDEE